VECGFLSNPADESMLIQPGHQKMLAESIAKGIIQYFTDLHTLPPKSKLPQPDME
jgi:N-acetylmuramoyl-L-alanine amidase